MSGAAGAAGRGAGSERGAAGPWGRGWPARRGGKGKRAAVSRKSGASGRGSRERRRAVASTGYPLSTPHGITSVIKGEPNWSGASTNRVCVACSCGKFRLGQSISRITSNVPPRDDCSSLPRVPVLTFRPAALAARTPTRDHSRSTVTASVSIWTLLTGASGGSVYAAARCASTGRFVIRHPSETGRFAVRRRVVAAPAAFGHPRRSPQRMTRTMARGSECAVRPRLAPRGRCRGPTQDHRHAQHPRCTD